MATSGNGYNRGYGSLVMGNRGAVYILNINYPQSIFNFVECFSASGACQRNGQFLPANADPSDLLSRITDHERMIGDVLGDDCSCADECIVANSMTANNGAVRTHCGTFFNKSRAHLIHLADFRTGIIDVGKDHGGSTEDTVFQGDAFVDADVVLDFTFVADDGVGANDDILSNVAVITDFGATQNVREMPDFRPGTDLDFVIDGGGGMCKNAGIFFGHLVRILDTGLRRYDEKSAKLTFYKTVKHAIQNILPVAIHAMPHGIPRQIQVIAPFAQRDVHSRVF